MKNKKDLMKFKVEEAHHGLSLLTFLKKKCPDLSSVKSLKRAIEAKECLVNGRVEFFSSYKLVRGDVVELRAILPTAPDRIDCEIVFEDASLLIINKPAGVLSDPSAIAKVLGKNISLFLIHRLDKNTSGLLMLAKTSEMLQKMKELFVQKEVYKYYIALVDGSLPKKSGVIENYLGKKGSYQGQTIYGQVEANQGDQAITYWKSLAKGLRCSLVLLEPKTGRTHQLRVHLKEMGHPILGDYQYAKNFVCPIQPSRQMLHAWALHFIHPLTQEDLWITSSIAEDFIVLSDQLKLSLHLLLSSSELIDQIQKKRK